MVVYFIEVVAPFIELVVHFIEASFNIRKGSTSMGLPDPDLKWGTRPLPLATVLFLVHGGSQLTSAPRHTSMTLYPRHRHDEETLEDDTTKNM